MTPATAAGAVLRARASRAGLELRTVTTVDLAAACLTLDAWMALVGADTLDRPQRYGAGSVEVVAAGLTRAAGRADKPAEVPVLNCPTAAWLLELADTQLRWAKQLAGDDVSSVLAAAAWDLWAGGEASVFASYGSLLAITTPSAH